MLFTYRKPFSLINLQLLCPQLCDVFPTNGFTLMNVASTSDDVINVTQAAVHIFHIKYTYYPLVAAWGIGQKLYIFNKTQLN